MLCHELSEDILPTDTDMTTLATVDRLDMAEYTVSFSNGYFETVESGSSEYMSYEDMQEALK